LSYKFFAGYKPALSIVRDALRNISNSGCCATNNQLAGYMLLVTLNLYFTLLKLNTNNGAKPLRRGFLLSPTATHILWLLTLFCLFYGSYNTNHGVKVFTF
jgi:hypothetical protein